MWMTDWLTDWLSIWLTQYLTDWLTDSVTDWLTDWLNEWMNEWMNEWTSKRRIEERKCIFYDELNSFYLQLGTRLERKPNAITSWATLFNSQQGIFYMHHSTYRIAHTIAFASPVVEHWLEQVSITNTCIWHYITVTKMCWVHLYIKHFL